MKKIISYVSSFLLILIVLVSCTPGSHDKTPQSSTNANDEKTVTVVTDAVLVNALKKAAAEFKKETGVTVLIEEIPGLDVDDYSSSEERESMITRLRTEIMAGKGPDAFLMAATFIDGEARGFVHGSSNGVDIGIYPLFRDPYKSALAGVFCDIEPLAGEAGIDFDNFIQPVLDSGKIEGKQYLFPLSYNFQSVIIEKDIYEANKEALENAADTVEFLAVLDRLDSSANNEPYLRRIDALSQCRDLMDYSNEILHWNDAFISGILELNRNNWEQTENGYSDSLYSRLEKTYVLEYMSSKDSRGLQQCVKQLYNEGKEAVWLPLPDSNGGVTAKVLTYYSIYANSQNKAEAAKLLELITRQHNLQNTDSNSANYGVALAFPTILKGSMEQRYPEDSGLHFLCEIENKITNAFILPASIQQLYTEIVEKYYTGDIDLQDAKDEMQRLLTQILYE